MKNPFHQGDAMIPRRFIGRRKILRRVFGRIAGHGQSIAIVGRPGTGKTAVLAYPLADGSLSEYFTPDGIVPCFASFGADDFDDDFKSVDFWRKALSTLSHLPESTPASVCDAVHDIRLECQRNSFSGFALERLLSSLNDINIRLVLLIDDFDQLIGHPGLGGAEFFGNLRSLTTRSQGTLTLLVSSRVSLTVLNRNAHRFNTMGSPYFNFLHEVVLDAWDEDDVETLIETGSDRLQTSDKRFIQLLAGAHPGLLQAVAAAVWDAHETMSDQPRQRLQHAAYAAYSAIATQFDADWQGWTDSMHVVLVALALQYLTMNQGYAATNVQLDVHEFALELRQLRKQGIVVADPACPSGHRIRPHALNWWLWRKIHLQRHQQTVHNAHFLIHDDHSIMSRTQWQQLSQVTSASRFMATG